MPINKLTKYIFRFLVLQGTLSFTTIYFFDNYLIWNKKFKGEIYQNLIEDKNRLLNRIKNVQKEMDFDFSSNNDPLEKLSKQKKNIYREVFGLVYELSPTQLAAKTLIDKILSRLSSI